MKPTLAALLVPVWMSASSLHAQTDERFGIQYYLFEGVSLVDVELVRQVVAPYKGRDRVYGDIQKAVEAIELLYKKAGYSAVEVFVPEQDISAGSVKINVVESAIGKLTVTGNQHFSADNVTRSLPELKPGKKPNIRKLSENIQLANSNPAKQVDAVLSVSEQEGKVDANVKVTDQEPLRYVLSLDNTGTPASGRHRASVAVQHANLWDQDHVGTLSYGTSVQNPSDVMSLSASYRIPFYRWGDSLDAYVGVSDSTNVPAGFKADVLQFNGKGTIGGLKYTHNRPRKGEYSGRVILSLDERRFLSEFEGSSGGGICSAAPVSCADHSVRPVGLTYSAAISGVGSVFDYSLGVVRNLGSSVNGEQSHIDMIRTGAKRDYSLLRASGQWFGNVHKAWQARVAANAQYSNQPLIPGEQLGLAGSNAVRGFNERAFATDSGLQITAELYAPPETDLFGVNGMTGRVLAFVDAAAGINEGRLKDTTTALAGAPYKKRGIASIGVGARVDYRKDVSVRIDAASILRQGTTDDSVKKDDVYHLSLLVTF